MSISLVYMALLLFAGPGMGRDPKVIYMKRSRDVMS